MEALISERTSKRKVQDCLSLRDNVKLTTQKILVDLAGKKVINVYGMLLEEIEEPLLHTMMHHYLNNQSAVARALGISRNTLRKKLEKYGM